MCKTGKIIVKNHVKSQFSVTPKHGNTILKIRMFVILFRVFELEAYFAEIISRFPKMCENNRQFF